METKQWRKRARVVAYLDLVLTSLTLLFFLLMTMTLGFLKELAEDREKVNKVLKTNPKFKFQSDEESEIDQDFDAHSPLAPANDVRVIRIGLAIFAACTLFTSAHLWAAIKLVNATEVEADTRDALKKTRFWKIVTAIYLSIHCAIAILALDFEFLVYNLAFMLATRGVFLYVIFKFREELEGALISLIPAKENPPPPYVSVVKE